MIYLSHDMNKRWPDESTRLATAGLRNADDIATAQSTWNRLGLNRRRRSEFRFAQRLHQPLVEPEMCEAHHGPRNIHTTNLQ